MTNYYSDKLNSRALFQVYDTAIPRVRQYLYAEIDFVRNQLSKTDRVLELAAGYGRIIKPLSPHCDKIIGMDISQENIELALKYLNACPNAEMVAMDVHKLTFADMFDAVLCLQNGMSAMRLTTDSIRNILDIVAPGGRAFFSTYSAKFWDWRVKWFEEQADKGLLGAIDYDKTKDGVIICKDGFRATTHTPEDYKKIGDECGYPYQIEEVDDSSLFLIIQKPKQ